MAITSIFPFLSDFRKANDLLKANFRQTCLKQKLSKECGLFAKRGLNRASKHETKVRQSNMKKFDFWIRNPTLKINMIECLWLIFAVWLLFPLISCISAACMGWIKLLLFFTILFFLRKVIIKKVTHRHLYSKTTYVLDWLIWANRSTSRIEYFAMKQMQKL